MTEQQTDATQPETSSNDGASPATEPAGQLGAGADVPEAAPSLDSESKAGPQTDTAKPTGDAAAADQQPEGAPETYESFTAPEGADLDSGVVTSFGEAAKAANLTQAAAQTMFDKLATGINAAATERITQLRQQWGEQLRADPELGGGKMAENLATARKAYDAFASPELRKLLKATGLESNPEIVRVFFKAGRAISDDSFIADGARGGSAGPDFATADIYAHNNAAAAKLFPTSAKRK